MRKPKEPAPALALWPHLKDEFYHIQHVLEVSADAHDANWRRWQKTLGHASDCRVPSPRPVTECGMTLTQLAKTNPRDVFAGRFVNCCMHPQGYAARCAWHGHESPLGAFWVVEFQNWIVAVAWVWRHTDRLVIDSVDVHEEFRDSLALIHEMYVEAAKSVLMRDGIQSVYAGVGYGETWMVPYWFLRHFESPARYSVNGLLKDDSAKIHVIADARRVYE
ncbi:MAG: hypothetical protein DI628_04640 [Blastochloris viridis]|uniref:Uncharacterized protein n=1 Tax=Blastochloris viridis TaxID=1079 RepID=A0A6N4R5H2_BLAVI|nr:MAG: hypothetical protein DI628_04640 [Blastochloris viridis]